jgi:hypothetical protein
MRSRAEESSSPTPGLREQLEEDLVLVHARGRDERLSVRERAHATPHLDPLLERHHERDALGSERDQRRDELTSTDAPNADRLLGRSVFGIDEGRGHASIVAGPSELRFTMWTKSAPLSPRDKVAFRSLRHTIIA